MDASKHRKLNTWLFVVAIIVFAVLGAKIQDNVLKKEALKTECAQYNQTTGDFEWIIKENK